MVLNVDKQMVMICDTGPLEKLRFISGQNEQQTNKHFVISFWAAMYWQRHRAEIRESYDQNYMYF